MMLKQLWCWLRYGHDKRITKTDWMIKGSEFGYAEFWLYTYKCSRCGYVGTTHKKPE